MLDGCVPCPPEVAKRWVDMGYWEGRTVAEMVQDRAAQHPDRVALIENGRTVTYAEMMANVDCIAAGLTRKGLRACDRVVMQLPNSIEFVLSFLALMRIGAIPVMALRAHRYSEIRHFVRASGAVAYMIPAVFNKFDYRVLADEVRGDCPTLEKVFVLGEPAAGQSSLDELIEASMSPQEIDDVLAGVQVDPREVAVMLLSGGTTSLSKLIPRTHDDYVLNARLCGRAAGFDAQTVLLALLPLGHNYNLAAPGMLGVFYFGGAVLIGHGTEAEQVFDLVERHRVTVIPAAVPLITNWLQSPVPAQRDLSSLKVVQNGGARLAPELRRRLIDQWQCIPQEIYGTAEGLINMTALDDPLPMLLESSGAPVCDEDEIQVVDDDGHDVPDGEPGELITRGPYTIHGYYNAAEKNQEAFTRDGFYRMGDVVRKRGRHVFAEGRKKDLINRGGEKISCEEVENLIFKHPAVHQVALVAMPDPVFGEKACAFVVTKPSCTLSFEELIDFLKAQQIASFKLPERLELVQQFPTSLVGKILKRQLRETIIERMRADDRAVQPGQ